MASRPEQQAKYDDNDCQLSGCLSDEDLSVLAADLVVLSDMLANIIARNAYCGGLQTEQGV